MSDADDRDLLAAEYVLGTLDAAERAAAASRFGDDADFARRVAAWEGRLAPLADAVAAVDPPDAVFDGIVARLFGPSTGASRPDGGATLRRLRRWQGATAGFALLAASLAAALFLRNPPPSAATRFTAVLQRDAGAPAVVIDVDPAARRLTVLPVSASAPAGHVYELWIIDPALGAPRSLGLLPARSAALESLAGFDPAVIRGATYAVTVEPAGGSPTGQPSGAPLLTGHLTPPAI